MESPDVSGREAYEQYRTVERRQAYRLGARPVFRGDVAETFAGPSEGWDHVDVMQYPSNRAFLTLTRLPSTLAVAHHKTAGLERMRVLVARPWPEFADGGS